MTAHPRKKTPFRDRFRFDGENRRDGGREGQLHPAGPGGLLCQS
jgi:hypothetical protein